MARQLNPRRRTFVWSAVATLVALAGLGAVLVLSSHSRSTGAERVTEPVATVRRPPGSRGRVVTNANLRWSAPTSGGEPMGVTADGGGVIAVSYDEVQLLDPSNGSERWHTKVGATPLVAPVRAAADADIVAVPTRRGVRALARADGAPRWEARFGVGLAAAGTTGPVALATAPGGARLVLGTLEDGTVAAFDRGSGSTTWRADFPGSIVTAPQVDEAAGVAVVAWHTDGTDGRVRALDLATGAVRWEAATLEKLAAPVARAGLVVLSEGDNHSRARIRALDAATGAPRWETAVPKSFEWETEPAADGDDYVTVDHFGTVTAVDLRTGALRWRRSGDWALLDSRILLTAKSVAFHDFAGHVVVLDRATGAPRTVTRPAGSVVDAGAADGLVVSAVGGFANRRFEAQPVP
jgi:outer membrane protein assembly factor BamB